MQQQLTFKLQELPSGGREWSLEIPRAVFEDAGVGTIEPPARLCSDVVWDGSVSAQGELFVLSGCWSIEMIRQCVRCNAEFPWTAQGDLLRYFQLGTPRQDSDDTDGCEILAPPGRVNLVDVIREEFWLAWKPMVVCSPSCKGLCQKCGENLNERECDCAQKDESHPFAALKNIRFDT